MSALPLGPTHARLPTAVTNTPLLDGWNDTRTRTRMQNEDEYYMCAEVGEVLRTTCHISFPLKNSLGYSLAGIDSHCSVLFGGNWLIQLYQKQGTNKTYW